MTQLLQSIWRLLLGPGSSSSYDMGMIYLDHNSTTPVLPEVLEAMLPYLTTDWGNPSSTYRFGAHLKGVLESARSHVADLIGARAREVLFTSCATESNNTALHAAITATGKRNIVTSAVEHSSVLHCCRSLEAAGCTVTYLPVNSEGLLDLADLENALTHQTALVSLMWANNETGVIFPVSEIAELCRSRKVLFHCDAVQAVGKILIDMNTVPVDYLSITGHKLNAPKGIGALYVRSKTPFAPLLYGGHQERNLRGGTESVPLIAGIGKAAELAHKQLGHYATRIRPARDALEAGILKSIPNTELNGHATQRLPNTSNITFHGIESEALLILLDQAGICASSGSACLADSDQPSHVIKAMKPETNASRQMIRFSLGLDTPHKFIDRAVDAIRRCVESLLS